MTREAFLDAAVALAERLDPILNDQSVALVITALALHVLDCIGEEPEVDEPDYVPQLRHQLKMLAGGLLATSDGAPESLSRVH